MATFGLQRSAPRVTPVQVAAAKLLIEMLEEDGSAVDERLRVLATLAPASQAPIEAGASQSAEAELQVAVPVPKSRGRRKASAERTTTGPDLSREPSEMAAAVQRLVLGTTPVGELASELRQLGVSVVAGKVPKAGPYPVDEERGLEQLREDINVQHKKYPGRPIELSLRTKDGIGFAIKLSGPAFERMIIGLSTPSIGLDGL
jgi:hypothetical protein